MDVPDVLTSHGQLACLGSSKRGLCLGAIRLLPPMLSRGYTCSTGWAGWCYSGGTCLSSLMACTSASVWVSLAKISLREAVI
ncbi:hypothetical protein V6N12_049285 [Hibiscus sabdariffa]|uniref:Uncharacterized protein n=1 Tax=Hibiscus sabdariffa TaxID=183260 RepID=A0ABR2EJR9_9ROSI